jgi:hypothetical protein
MSSNMRAPRKHNAIFGAANFEPGAAPEPTARRERNALLYPNLENAMISRTLVAKVLSAALIAVLSAHSVRAEGAVNRGDAVATGFSGVRASGTAAKDPMDETFIDVDGVVMRVLPLEASTPPAGQLLANPSRLDVKARDVGQVFGIALDDGLVPDPIAAVPNVYLGATSSYGLQIVIPDVIEGRPQRITKGHPNAEWMTGQFGPGGEPGSIWKIDGKSRTASLFATIPKNSGPGIGNIVFDPASRHLFVSDLDTGFIHRIDMAGNPIDMFDHGVAGRTGAGLASISDDGIRADIKSRTFNSLDPATWGLTQPERRVWGLAINSGRLYYSVASGPEVWSVSLSLTGAFGTDVRREFDVSGTPGNHAISDITFDGEGQMYIAQRGDVRGSYDYVAFTDGKPSVVFRYKREIPDDPATPGTWNPIPDEIAVGHLADYRNSSGGIALGYGYDETGQMRMGSCGAMLWATGNNLSSIEDDATRSIGVHGLQGSDRTLVRPDNEPPKAAYVVDTLNRTSSTAMVGHAGDVETWQPCEKLMGPDPEFNASLPDWPAGYSPPGDIPPDGFSPPANWPALDFNLRVDKIAQPAACGPGGLGFLCTFIVRVTNTGPDPYIGAVTVEDHLPAAPAGASMSFDNQPPWACLAIDPTQHTCTSDPTVLWPGTSIDLKVMVDTPAPAPVCSLANVVRLKWPWGIADSNPGDDFDLAIAGIPAAHCPPIGGELANLKIQKSWWGGVEPVCKDEPGHFACEFLISVINAGPGTYNGPFEIEEQIPAGTTVSSTSPAMTCANGAPATCAHDPVVLGANQGLLLGVVVKVPKDMADDLSCKLTNTVKIIKAPGGSDQNTDASDDEAQHDAIIPGTLAQCPDLELSNLKIQTTDATGGKCPVKDGQWECLFKVRVWNFGQSYNSTLKFKDIAPWVPSLPGVTLSMQAPPTWQCDEVFAAQQVCRSDDPGLGAGESVEFMATVKVPLAPAGQCWIKNRAIILQAPGETAQNTFAGDDTSQATAQFESVYPLNGDPYCLSPMVQGPDDTIVMPEDRKANLAIAKTAGASTKTGTGQSTPFAITVTNTGPGVFTGPIVVRETLPVEPSNGSWSAPWTCEGQSAAGHPEQGLCAHPPVNLNPGESVALDMDMEMPDSFVLPEGADARCGYTNKAEIVTAAGGTSLNTSAADDTATADVQFAPFENHGQTFCRVNVLTTPLPPPPVCPQGWSKTPVPGKCCPAKSVWDGERCARDVPPDTCKRKTCGRDQVWDAADCRCVERPCPTGTAGKYPNCKTITENCPAGFTGTPPNCERIVVLPPKCVKIACGPNATWDGATCGCVAKTCSEGTRGTYPKCKADVCPKGMTGAPPNCRKVPETCGPGFRGTPPNCIKILDPPKCPEGFTGRPPNCTKVPATCGPGFRGTPPKCIKIVDPPKCPEGTTGRPPNCKKVPPPKCPKGFTGTPPNCKRTIADPPKNCPAGMVGKPPNCRKIPQVCPPGFTGKPPKCNPILVPNVKPVPGRAQPAPVQ